MANPAELLYEHLTAFRGSTNYPNTRTHRLAVSHLDAIEEMLNRMDEAKVKSVPTWRRYFDQWVELTLHTPHVWQTNSNLRHKDDYALEQLAGLADRMDDFMPTLRPDGIETVVAYAQGITALLDDDDSISRDLRLHLRQVIAHVEQCAAEFAIVGEFNLQQAVERLLAVVALVTTTSSKRSKWAERLGQFFWPFTAGAAANVAATPIQAVISTAITGGT